MTVSDQIIGSAFVATAVAVFTYYALWVLVTVRPLPLAAGAAALAANLHTPRGKRAHSHASPSLPAPQPWYPPTHPLQSFFLDRWWAIYLPALALSAGVALTGAYIASALLCKKKKPAASPVAPAAPSPAPAAPAPKPASAAKPKPASPAARAKSNKRK